MICSKCNIGTIKRKEKIRFIDGWLSCTQDSGSLLLSEDTIELKK